MKRNMKPPCKDYQRRNISWDKLRLTEYISTQQPQLVTPLITGGLKAKQSLTNDYYKLKKLQQSIFYAFKLYYLNDS